MTERAVAQHNDVGTSPIHRAESQTHDTESPMHGADDKIPARGQLRALTARGVIAMIRNGEVVFAFLAPAFLATCFYLPLRSVMDRYPGMDYAQYLMPIITLQSLAFVGATAAMRSSFDRVKGINTRFRTLPMSASVPVLARAGTNAVLLIIALACATIASLIIGWRPQGSVVETVGLYAIAIVIGLFFTLVTDAVGLLAGSPEATSQALALPVLVLGMLSTGFAPVDQFPDWIAPFVRNQPISQFANALRSLTDGTSSWAVVAPALWWCVGLGLLGVALTALAVRRTRG